jgi:nudix-type nucleoside diphosphatase (YffH/AdpP family)
MSGAVRVTGERVAHEGWSRLTVYEIEQRRRDGRVQRLSREVHDHGDGAAVLLYDPERRLVLLVRQFRLPDFLRGGDGMVVEVPAGMLDRADPETRVLAEAEEETGFRPRAVRKLFALWSSPGAVAERIHLFAAAYGPEDRVGPGGGAAAEGEEIEVLETPFDEAMAMLGRGEIGDLKTATLLQWAALNVFL